MPKRPDDIGFVSGDRERQRAVANEGRRFASATESDDKQRSASSIASAHRQRSNRGFASMDQRKQKEIASKGGKAAHAKGTAHEFDSTEAREAGRKGGLAVSRDRAHMAQIGRRGGEARGASRGRAPAQGNTGGLGGRSEGAMQNTRAGEGQRSEGFEGGGEDDMEREAFGAANARGGSSFLTGDRRPSGG